MNIKFVLLSVFSCLSTAFAVDETRVGCANVHFVDRKTWGAPNVEHTPLPHLPVRHVFFHHTDMAFCNDTTSCSQEMRNIYELHTTPPRSWSDIGYNFLIGGDGKVYIGRNWNAVGAHTYGMNSQSVAFSFMGDYMDIVPNNAMLEAGKNLIQCGIELGYVASAYQLHGHRDQGCTDCPGDAFYSLIETWPRFIGGPLDTYICRNPPTTTTETSLSSSNSTETSETSESSLFFNIF